ncbi:retrovirus-related pol polyprotein from transposon TNT 1-94 [Tanacetum coccineum]|uniref:Retrovirus-related pol polyprotein from transposon TNT 1-94 n=1 Tax=Tanacetum coccineum TaxID=301880 RepID=A0ABQ4XUF0_9ASTR
MLPLLSYQKLTNHIDGTTAPLATITSETAYSNSSVERIHSLRDSLRNLSKGTSTVSDYGRQFKGICDKLAGIRQPVDEMDKLHWRPPHCQLCHTNGYYASSCPSLYTYASNAAISDANLAQAFTSQCHVNSWHPDWSCHQVSSYGLHCTNVIFVDDYSRFTWFYPLKTKSGFYTVLSAFIKLVQTQLSRKIKVFQSDGGTEFVNHTVRKFFEDNGTLHRLSCPYTPQQNGRAERKHRHLVETGLAMLFHAHVPASYWVEALVHHLPNYTNFRAFGCLVNHDFT